MTPTIDRTVALLVAVLLTLAGVRAGRNGTPDVERLAASLTGGGDHRPVLAVLFQPADCTVYSGLVEQWNRLYATGSVRALGLGIRFEDHDQAGFRSWAGPHPEFPVRFDLSDLGERVLSALGQTHTPTAVLLDPDGRVRAVVPPTKDPDLERRLGALVEAHIEAIEE